MSRRVISRAGGFVHDIEMVSSLSGVASNLRLLSDRSLYILQNLSGEDVTFESRYGEIETDGFYIPVQPGTAEASTVYDAVSLIRRDLNDMTVEQTLECICEQLKDIAAGISAASGATGACTVGSDVDTSDGEQGGSLPDPVNGVEYEEPSAIDDRKCKAANYIHGSISEVVNELKLNRADQYGFAGLVFVLSLVTTIVGGLILGPFGILLGAVVSSYLAMATLLFKASFSLTLLESAITADEPGAICALYGAGSASVARSNYVTHLLGEGATSLEIEFVEYLLSNTLLNLLFFAWGDSEDAIENTPIISVCSSCSVPTVVPVFVGTPQAVILGDDRFFPADVVVAQSVPDPECSGRELLAVRIQIDASDIEVNLDYATSGWANFCAHGGCGDNQSVIYGDDFSPVLKIWTCAQNPTETGRGDTAILALRGEDQFTVTMTRNS